MRQLAIFVLLATACGDDGGTQPDPDSGPVPGSDTLPKAGPTASAPTIVSAEAFCLIPTNNLGIRITGADSAGVANLETCAATIDNVTASDTFAANGTCVAQFRTTCMRGAFVADLTVTNKTAGVTTASITLAPN